jgi:hypothetical protein
MLAAWSKATVDCCYPPRPSPARLSSIRSPPLGIWLHRHVPPREQPNRMRPGQGLFKWLVAEQGSNLHAVLRGHRRTPPCLAALCRPCQAVVGAGHGREAASATRLTHPALAHDSAPNDRAHRPRAAAGGNPQLPPVGALSIFERSKGQPQRFGHRCQHTAAVHQTEPPRPPRATCSPGQSPGRSGWASNLLHAPRTWSAISNHSSTAADPLTEPRTWPAIP